MSAVNPDPEALERLNSISHPAINHEIERRLLASNAEIVVLDMAILVESRLGRLPAPLGYTRVITVEATPSFGVSLPLNRSPNVPSVAPWPECRSTLPEVVQLVRSVSNEPLPTKLVEPSTPVLIGDSLTFTTLTETA